MGPCIGTLLEYWWLWELREHWWCSTGSSWLLPGWTVNLLKEEPYGFVLLGGWNPRALPGEGFVTKPHTWNIPQFVCVVFVYSHSCATQQQAFYSMVIRVISKRKRIALTNTNTSSQKLSFPSLETRDNCSEITAQSLTEIWISFWLSEIISWFASDQWTILSHLTSLSLLSTVVGSPLWLVVSSHYKHPGS